MENAKTVIRFSQGSRQFLVGRAVVAGHNVAERTLEPFAVRILDINALGSVATGIGNGAITLKATDGSTFGSVLPCKICKRAERMNLFALLIKNPLQNVKVVTALCQKHGRGFLFRMPVSAHIAVGEMKITNTFNVIHRNDLTELAAHDDRSDLFEKVRVSENVADKHANALLFCGVCNISAFASRGCDGFFQKNVVTQFNGFHRGCVMIRIQCRDHGKIRHFRTIENITPIEEASLVGYAVITLHTFSFGIYRLCNADDLLFVRHIPHDSGITSSSASRADDDNGNLLHVYFSFSSSEYLAKL